tara:strand:+ start:65 stop:430 length:366 start_codon:yes stop_codon:yes gene_type:complete
MTKPSKASLVKDLKKANIDVPASAKIADMQHRLKYWKDGEGILFRLLKNPNASYNNHPISLVENRDSLYWMPNSEMSERIIKTRLVLILGRTNKPSKDAIVIDVPSDYDSRWIHGGNNITN